VLALPIMAARTTSALGFVQSLLFIPYRTGATTFPVHAGGWTLNFEMFFYCVFACAIWLPRRSAVATVCVFLAALIAIGRFAKFDFAPLAVWSDPIVIEFVFGMLLALAYRRGVRLPVAIRTALVFAGASSIWFFAPNGTAPSQARVLMWGLPMALLFAGTVLGDDIDFGSFTIVVKMLGDASYAMYLFHPIFAAEIIIYWTTGPLTVYPMALVLSVGVALSIVVPIAVFLMFERHVTKFIRWILSPRLRLYRNRLPPPIVTSARAS
jgi:exopolysaccharide production protein ExoZ